MCNNASLSSNNNVQFRNYKWNRIHIQSRIVRTLQIEFLYHKTVSRRLGWRTFSNPIQHAYQSDIVQMFSIIRSYQRSFGYNTSRLDQYTRSKLKFKARDNNFVHFCFIHLELSGNSFGGIFKSDGRVCEHFTVEFPCRLYGFYTFVSCVMAVVSVYESANASNILYVYRHVWCTQYGVCIIIYLAETTPFLYICGRPCSA